MGKRFHTRHGVMIPMQNRLKRNEGRVPLRAWLAAGWSWSKVLPAYAAGVALTYCPMGALVALTARPSVNHLGERAARHKFEYAAAGSSGWWEYWASPWALLAPWNNFEDGTLGEPSGKHSAHCAGRERSIWQQFLWTCRNPFNQAKRTSRFFACYVNDCTLEYWGDFNVSDKTPAPGWHFVIATDPATGRRYYGYRKVSLRADGTLNQATLGFKLKPAHGITRQDADDLDKAFTFRVQLGASVD